MGKDRKNSLFSLSLSSLPLSLFVMWRRDRMMAICKPGREFSSGTKSALTLILNLIASRTARNKYLLFKPPSGWYFVTVAHTDQNSNFTWFWPKYLYKEIKQLPFQIINYGVRKIRNYERYSNYFKKANKPGWSLIRGDRTLLSIKKKFWITPETFHILQVM